MPPHLLCGSVCACAAGCTCGFEMTVKLLCVAATVTLTWGTRIFNEWLRVRLFFLLMFHLIVLTRSFIFEVLEYIWWNRGWQKYFILSSSLLGMVGVVKGRPQLTEAKKNETQESTHKRYIHLLLMQKNEIVPTVSSSDKHLVRRVLWEKTKQWVGA